jgi:hypothetical protein
LPIIQTKRNFYRFFIYSDTATIITGTKKLGFWETSKMIDVTHSNKYINNGKVDHYEVVQNKNFSDYFFLKLEQNTIRTIITR